MEPEIVFLTEERCLAELVRLGAHASLVRYRRMGIEYEVVVTNDEFEYIKGGSGGESED